MSRVVYLWHSKAVTTEKKVESIRHGQGLRWQTVWTDGLGGERKKSHRTEEAATQ